MKKFLHALSFIGKALLLIVLLLAGWVFINATNLIKGKKTADKIKDPSGEKADFLKIQDVYADHSKCPHVASFDGSRFKIENDFLLAWTVPGKGMADYETTRHHYEQGLIKQDLMKFTSIPQKKDGEMVLQFHEFEMEETFIDQAELVRVLHPQESEAMVSVKTRTVRVFDKQEALKNIILPHQVLRNGKDNITTQFSDKDRLWAENSVNDGPLLDFGEEIEFSFSLVSKEKELFLVINSGNKKWMVEEKKSTASDRFLLSLIRAKPLAVAASTLLAMFYLDPQKKFLGNALTLAPFVFFGIQGCVALSYKNEQGSWQHSTIYSPRDWKPLTEVIPLPNNAVRKDGTAQIKARITNQHNLNFVGILPAGTAIPHREETLNAIHTEHSRQGDLADRVNKKNGEFLHLIPGDTATTTFENPAIKPSEDEKETYFLRSSGFISLIRPEYKKLAGEWMEKIPQEAKDHYKKILSKG